ncbi:uncharacterized protein LOC119168232 isoform X2 [Rhipicephalus microplus]|uniref:uncharacterized protein LOC119168232 isoform X2 n=1 Tax=Rhipicephalus microplus TaxID=6941 RepID=UPI003F6C246C
MNKRVFLAPGKRTAAQAAPRPNSVAPRKRTAAQAAPRPNSVGVKKRACAVIGCEPSCWRQEKRHHKVPVQQGSRRTEWLRRIGLSVSEPRLDLRVCGRHFKPEDYSHNSELMERLGTATIKPTLNPGALPCRFLPDPQVPNHLEIKDEAVVSSSTSLLYLQVHVAQPGGSAGESPAATAVTANESIEKCAYRAASKETATQATPEFDSAGAQVRPCSVVGCKPSNWRLEKRRHAVPQQQGRRRTEWLRRIGLSASDLRQDLRVCGRHFTLEDYRLNFEPKQPYGVTITGYSLHAEALPSLHLPDPKKSMKKHVCQPVLKTTAAQAKQLFRSVATQVHMCLQIPANANTQTMLVTTAEAAVQT